MNFTLNINDPKVFDTWREVYKYMTGDSQARFHDAIESKYPTQRCFNLKNFQSVLQGKKQVKVLEVGGWKGELAAAIFNTMPPDTISEWKNIELCKAAVIKTVDMPKWAPYIASVPTKFNWFEDRRAERPSILVCSHVIEHLVDDDLLKLLGWAAGIPLICLEAPIGEGESDWTGYKGTHILKAGWKIINTNMQQLGYRPLKVDNHTYHYEYSPDSNHS